MKKLFFVFAWLSLFSGNSFSQNILLSEDFSGPLDPRITPESVGLTPLGEVSASIFGAGSHAWCFGKSTCGSSCFWGDTSALVIDFGHTVHIDSISFDEIEGDGTNWGSEGYIWFDNMTWPGTIGSPQEAYGRIPADDRGTDLTYRSHHDPIGMNARRVSFDTWDITSSCDIYMTRIVIYGSNYAHPNQPTGLIDVPQNHSVSLSWQASTSPNVRYRVYRSLTSGSQYVRVLDSIPGTTATDTGLTNGKQYFYVVRAFDSVESGNSNEVSAIPLAPDSGWADMRISLNESATSVVAQSNAQITYSMSYANRGTADAKNVNIIALIPSGTEYVSGSAVVTGSTTTLSYTTQSGDLFDGNVTWSQTQPPVQEITGIEWSIPDYAPDCKDCSSEIAYGVQLLNSTTCGTSLQSQAQVRDGVPGADLDRTNLVETNIYCNGGPQIDAVSISPNPIQFGNSFNVTLTISNHGSQTSLVYSNLMLNMYSESNTISGEQWFPLAMAYWLNSNGHSASDPRDITIPALAPGKDTQIILQNISFLSLGVPLQDFNTISPDRTVQFELTNHDVVTDPTHEFSDNIIQSENISPNSNDAMNCAMSILDVLTVGGVDDARETFDQAKDALNFVLGAQALLVAAQSGNMLQIADAAAKLLSQIVGGEALDFINELISDWDGITGCAKELQYYLLYAATDLSSFIDRGSVMSPVYVSVQNPSGQVAGWLPNSDTSLEIPQTAVWMDSLSSDANFIFHHSDTLDFQLYGYDSGAFTFVAGITLDSTHLLKVTFQDTAHLGMYAYFHYRKGVTPYILEIDTNGDGIIDTTIATAFVELITTPTCTIPSITSNPAGESVCIGMNATFNAGALGTPEPTVQWQQSTDNGSSWSNISGAISSTYSATATSAMNGYQYQAVFSNTCGTVTTSAATLTVFPTPTIAVSLSPISLWPPNNKMNTIAAKVTTTGNCTPLTVQLVSVTANEPISTGDIIASTGTDALSFQVRAARNGNGDGRIYTALYKVTDAVGNIETASATITIPHDQGAGKIADGGQSNNTSEPLTVTVHPNPASSSVKVCVEDLPEGIPVVVNVVNQTGVSVATLYDATPEAELGLCLSLDCSKLPSGIYYADLQTEGAHNMVKFSVEH